MAKLIKLFPTQVHVENLKSAQSRQLNARLSREITVLSEIDQVGRKWSKKNYGPGYTSYSSITDLPFRSSNFGKLKEFMDREVNKFGRALDIDFSQGSLELTDCWVNRMEKGCHHSYHLHPLSVISGTYYVDAPPGSGAFKVEDPRLPAYMGSAPRLPVAKLDNEHFHKFRPAAGTLILFESWLKHEVEVHLGTKPRLSVSFNYGWVPLP